MTAITASSISSKSLVIGQGTLGKPLAKRLQCPFTTRQTLDLTADPAGWHFPACDIAYLCAAVTKLEMCENDPQGTRLVNVTRTVELARRLHAQGAFVVFVSSNHVFDGSKPFRRFDETPCPVNEYGRQKAEAERAILALGHSAVLRLSKVMHTPFPLFEQWKAALPRGENVRAFADMAVSPVPLALAVEALMAVGEAKQPGIWQCSGPRDASYYELALALARRIGAQESLVIKALAVETGLPPAFVPAFSTYENRLPVPLPLPDPLELL